MFDNFSLTQVGVKEITRPIKSQSIIEAKINADMSLIKKVLSVSAKVYPNMSANSVSEGIVKYGGTCCFTMLYQDDEGAIKKSENMVEFSHSCQNADIKGGANASIKMECEKTEVKNNLFSCILCSEIFLNYSKNISFLDQAQDIMFKKEEITLAVPSANINAVHKLTEKINKNDTVEEILMSGASVVLKESTCSSLSLICEGDVYLNILVKIGGGEIKSYLEKIPFKAEMKNEMIMPNFYAVCDASVKLCRVAAESFENSKKSILIADIELNICGEAYEQRTIESPTDAFSIKNHIELSSSTAEYAAFKKTDIFTEKISGNSNAAVVFENPVKIIAVTPKNIMIANTAVSENTVTVDGIIAMDAVYKDIEDKMSLTELEFPFSCNLSLSDLQKNDIIRLSALVSNVYCKCKKEKEIETDAELKIKITVYSLEKISGYDNIKLLQEKEERKNAVTVYFPKGEDSLWDVAKELNCTGEEIMSQNKDLKFPVGDSQQFVVLYKQRKIDY